MWAFGTEDWSKHKLVLLYLSVPKEGEVGVEMK